MQSFTPSEARSLLYPQDALSAPRKTRKSPHCPYPKGAHQLVSTRQPCLPPTHPTPLPSSVQPPGKQRCPGLGSGHQPPTPDTCFQASLSRKEGRRSGQLGQGSECSKPHFCHRFGKNRAPSLLKWTRATCPENSVLCTADLERAKAGLSAEYSRWECGSPQHHGKPTGGIEVSCKMKQKIVLSSKRTTVINKL